MRRAEPVVVVRYAEVGVKLGRVRRFFEERLVRTLRCFSALNGFSVEFRLYPGRIIGFVERFETAIEVSRLLALAYGVASVSPAWLVDKDILSLGEDVILLMGSKLSRASSFAVRARRVEVYHLQSKEIERFLGTRILSAFRRLRVDLSNPEAEVYVDVRKGFALIYDTVVEGVGGLPYGVEGTALVPVHRERLVESLLVAWLAARRGARLKLYTHPEVSEAVDEFVEKLVPCMDADIVEVNDPLRAVAEDAVRYRGLPLEVEPRCLETIRGRVCLLSPLFEAPRIVVEKGLSILRNNLYHLEKLIPLEPTLLKPKHKVRSL